MIEHTFIVVCEVPECVGIGGRSKLPVVGVRTPAQALALARSAGWRRTSGHDICEVCWKAHWRYQGGFYKPERRKP